VLRRAGEEARGLRHSYVGTEHILLALLHGQPDPAVDVLGSFGVGHEQVRTAIVRMMGLGVEPEGGELQFTGRAEEAIELARTEASERGRGQADTDDLLLALVRERDGAAARILLELDVDPAAIRSALAS
jgi:ATP-dependent Clp protease ATP-binding subunit ClpC